jgi:hypothetical protein
VVTGACNPIIVRESADDLTVFVVWCKRCGWESAPTSSMLAARLRRDQHKATTEEINE